MVYNYRMSTAAVVGVEGRYAYLLKTNVEIRRRVQRVQQTYGVSYNDALNILLREALDARGITEEK